MKKILSIVLALVLCLTTGVFVVYASSYDADYHKWSQTQSSDSLMKKYGCVVVAQAIMLRDSGVETSSSFNPDVYRDWEYQNGYLDSGFYQTSFAGPEKYAQQKGKTLKFQGKSSSSIENKIKENVKNGYYSIVQATVKLSDGTTSGHYMLVNNQSSSNGTIYCYNWGNPGQKLWDVATTLHAVFTYIPESPFIYIDIPQVQYRIKNVATGKYLNASGTYKNGNYTTTDVGVAALNTSAASQKWNALLDSLGYKLHNDSNSKVLNPFGSSASAGDNVCLWDFVAGDATQRWKFQQVSGGYVIHNVYSPNNVVTVDGTNVVLKAYSAGNNNQIWVMEPTAVETFKFDVNVNADGTAYNSGHGNVTFDVTINGTKVADDVRDFCEQYQSGTTYTINDIKVTGCFKNNGSASFSGTTKNENTAITIPIVTQHSFDSGRITTAATCTSTGVKTYTCSGCGTTKTETVAALGHNYGAWTKLNDTQHQRVCARDASHVEKANHTWDAGKVTKEPAVGVAGEKTYTCTVCKATKTEVIPPIDDPTPANPDAVLEIASATTQAGKTVTLDVYITKAAPINFMRLSLRYDTAALTLQKAENSGLFDTFDQGVNLMFSTDGDVNVTGKLMTLTFLVNENAPAGEYPITLLCRECYSADEKTVQVAMKDGVVTVQDFVLGDVNGDGKVDGRDLVRLRKYLANYDESTGTSNTEIFAGAEVTGDSKVDGRDLIRLRKYLANYDEDTGTSTVKLG